MEDFAWFDSISTSISPQFFARDKNRSVNSLGGKALSIDAIIAKTKSAGNKVANKNNCFFLSMASLNI